MSGMSLAAAMAHLQRLLADAEEANGMSLALHAKTERIANGLNMLTGSGISPERMPSTQYLANEIKEIQSQQRSRIHALLQGINEMIG